MVDYQPDRYELPAQTRSLISQRWRWYLREYGYSAGTRTARYFEQPVRTVVW
jgi:hypothetical protein